MAAHPTSVGRDAAGHITTAPLRSAIAPDVDVSGNAGPDCFWLPGGSTLPTPRIAAVHSLDQQPKPPRSAPSS